MARSYSPPCAKIGRHPRLCSWPSVGASARCEKPFRQVQPTTCIKERSPTPSSALQFEQESPCPTEASTRMQRTSCENCREQLNKALILYSSLIVKVTSSMPIQPSK